MTMICQNDRIRTSPLLEYHCFRNTYTSCDNIGEQKYECYLKYDFTPFCIYKLRWVADKDTVKNTFKFNCLQTAIRGNFYESLFESSFEINFLIKSCYENLWKGKILSKGNRVKESKNNSTTDFPPWLMSL